MRSILALFLATSIFTTALHADIPQSFDPRREVPKGQNIEGSAFIIEPSPLESCHLIVTKPLQDNPDNKYFTYRANLKAGLKTDPLTYGTFTMVNARRIKRDKKTGATFEIVSLVPILSW